MLHVLISIGIARSVSCQTGTRHNYKIIPISVVFLRCSSSRSQYEHDAFSFRRRIGLATTKIATLVNDCILYRVCAAPREFGG
jgi:hypothetical protein